MVDVGVNNDSTVTRSLRLDVVHLPRVESHANRETIDELSNYLCNRRQDRRFLPDTLAQSGLSPRKSV